MDKYKAVLFLIAYGTNVYKNNKKNFDDDFFLGQAIYNIRNLNHRGNRVELSDNLKNIMESPVHSMCTMLGFYAHFMAGIKNHYPITANIVEFAESCCEQSIS